MELQEVYNLQVWVEREISGLEIIQKEQKGQTRLKPTINL